MWNSEYCSAYLYCKYQLIIFGRRRKTCFNKKKSFILVLLIDNKTNCFLCVWKYLLPPKVFSEENKQYSHPNIAINQKLWFFASSLYSVFLTISQPENVNLLFVFLIRGTVKFCEKMLHISELLALMHKLLSNDKQVRYLL